MNEDFTIEDFGVMYQDDTFTPADDQVVSQLKDTDGFIVTMNNCVYPDLYYWSNITGMSVNEIIDTYNGKLIWLDPERYKISGDRTVGWVTKEQYLTGRVDKKYKLAVEMHEKTGLFEENIKLLRDNLPDKPSCEDIHISMSATWIPTWIIAKFVKWLFHTYFEPVVETDLTIGKKMIYRLPFISQVLNYKTYGTVDMSAIKIIEHIINGSPLKAYDQVPKADGSGGMTSVVNAVKTVYLNEKASLIKEKWQEFITSHDVIEEAVWKAYNENFGYHVCQFDGSYLKLEDANSDIQLYSYQKDAIAHGLFSPHLLLAHMVGAGKTWVYSAIVHECQRLGLSRRALIVVPNATLNSAAEAYKELYPNTNMLVVGPKKEFAPSNRKQTLEDIKSGKYDVIFMAYSSFDMLTMSKAYSLKKRKDKIDKLIIEERTKSSRMSTKYKAVIRNLKKSYEKYEENFKETECTCFDELGIDHIVVDEAHNYKNISLQCSYDNIVGLNSKGSKKADNMLEKIDYIRQINGRVVMATGTPITNSLAELYVFQRYLQPGELKLCNIYHFSDWIASFAEEETSFEVDVDSVNGKFATRFSRFHNLPELMGLISQVVDFYQADSDEENLPNFNGYTDVVVKKNKAQTEYIKNIASRTEAIRSRKVDRKEDNLLKITVQGRQAATDIRLVNPDAPLTDEDNKVKVCAETMSKIYFANPSATQIAFSDIGTPKDAFNLYDALKDELVKRGVKADEIAFIHDADTETKRAKVEKQFDQGKLKILVGSTQKLGTGVNVQSHLLAVHHLDVPWRPADMVQREGRIIRQGNLNDEVFIYRYITEASFDAYTYQLLENKQKFISQFLSGAMSAVHREETDCSDTVLSYAEVKALAIGNPLIKERVEVSNTLEHVKINQRARRREIGVLHELLESIPRRIQETEALIETCTLDMERYQECNHTMKQTERIQYSKSVLEALKDNVMKEEETIFGEYKGFEVVLPKFMKADMPYVTLRYIGKVGHTVHMDFRSSDLGCIMRMDHVLGSLKDAVERHKNNLQELYNQERQAMADIEQGNQYDAEVDALSKRLVEIDVQLKGEDVA